jgi:hypothetical protein
MNNILNLLSFDGFISVNKVLIRKLGLEEACVVGFLATMHDYHASKNSDGWFFVKYDIADNDEDLDEYRRNTVKYQLGLSEEKFLKFIKRLENIDIIFTKKKGIPMRKFYKFNADVIRQLLIEEGAVEPVNKGTRSSSAKHGRLLPQNTEDCSLKTRKIYKEKINKKESISLLKNVSPEDVTLDLIKEEAERREKDIKSFIKDELGKKISDDEYKKLFETFCNNYYKYIQRREIRSYEDLFSTFISQKTSYESNEPTKQSFVLPKSKNPPPPILKLGLADTSKDFINSSEKWQKLLQENFEQDIFDKWIKCLVPHRKEGKEVIFSVKEKFVRDWILREYQKKIEGLLDLKIIIIATEL